MPNTFNAPRGNYFGKKYEYFKTACASKWSRTATSAGVSILQPNMNRVNHATAVIMALSAIANHSGFAEINCANSSIAMWAVLPL